MWQNADGSVTVIFDSLVNYYIVGPFILANGIAHNWADL
jgi:hypothetical protein